MKKLVWLILPIILILLLIGSFIFFDKTNSNNQNASSKSSKLNDSISSCMRNSSPEVRGNCIIQIAKSKNNESICEYAGGYMLNPFEQTKRCYSEMAEAKNNPSICDKLKSQDMIDYCYLQYALNKKDTLICNKAGNKSHECVIEIMKTIPT